MIIRELVTKLSFDVDRRGIENFNRSIIGFKTKFAIAATAVTGFVTGVVKAVSAVSDAILDTDELSRSTGIAIKELVGLQKAAGQFRISDDQFSSSLINFNRLVRNARQGVGALHREAQEGTFEIRGGNGRLLTTQQILENVLKALSRVENEADRRDLAQRLFGNERFSDIAKFGIENFKLLAKEFDGLGEKFEENKEKALNFDRSLNRLGNSAKELAFNIFPPLFNVLGQAFEDLNLLIDSTEKKGFLETAFESIGTLKLKHFLGLGLGLSEFVNKETDQQSRSQNSNSINMRNSINITVPPGTEDTQAQFIKQGVEEAMNEVFELNFETIGDNFPVTE